MKRVIFFSLIFALILCLIDTAIISHLRIFFLRPEVVLVLVLYLALYNGSLTGVIVGFLAGLILDFLSLSPLGLHSIMFVIFSFFIGKMHGQYNVSKFFIPIFLTAVALLVKVVLTYALAFVFGKNILVPNLFATDFWISFVVTTLFSPLLFYFFNLFPTLLKQRDLLWW